MMDKVSNVVDIAGTTAGLKSVIFWPVLVDLTPNIKYVYDGQAELNEIDWYQ